MRSPFRSLNWPGISYIISISMIQLILQLGISHPALIMTNLEYLKRFINTIKNLYYRVYTIT